MLLAEEEASVFMVFVSKGDLVCSLEYERLFHALGVEDGLVAGLAGDGFLRGAVLGVGVVVMTTMGGKAVAKPAADVREETSRRWVADWKLDAVSQSMCCLWC